jgi:hypothetical protein
VLCSRASVDDVLADAAGEVFGEIDGPADPGGAVPTPELEQPTTRKTRAARAAGRDSFDMAP